MRRAPLALILCFGLLTSSACGGDDGGQTAGTTGESSSTSASSTETTESVATETSATETETAATETETGGDSCYAELHAIVTDIDETLTTADNEFLMQLIDSTYDPLEREEGAELIDDYHQRGYFVVYLTARSEAQSSIDNNTPARELTEAWLADHGFPLDDNTRVILANGLVSGDSAAMYKGQALIDMQGEGYSFDYAYGNADSDIAGYEMAGIAKDATFIIGPEAGMAGTVPVLEDDWVAHRASHIPTVPNYCEG